MNQAQKTMVTQKITKVVNGVRNINHYFALIRNRRSLLISFAGQDGTGKTTQARALYYGIIRTLKTKNNKNFRVRYVWSRGNGSLIEPIMRGPRALMLGKPVGKSKSFTYKNKRQRLLTNEPMKTIWSCLLLADVTMKIFTKVKIPLMLGYIIICDRYIYDAFVDITCNLNKKVNPHLQKIIAKMLPNPEIKIITTADPKEIIKRKVLVNPKLVYRQAQSYQDYVKSGEFIVIDTSNDFRQNKENVLAKVLESSIFKSI